MTETPEGLHANQYAMKLLEDRLAWPALPANIKLVAGCIEAIAKKWRRSPAKAYEWLDKKLKMADEQGYTMDYKFFSEAKYNSVQAPSEFKGTYVSTPKEEIKAAEEWRKTEDFQKFVKESAERVNKAFAANPRRDLLREQVKALEKRNAKPAEVPSTTFKQQESGADREHTS